MSSDDHNIVNTSDESAAAEDKKKKKVILLSIIAFLLVAAVTAGILIYRDRITAISIRLQRMVGIVNLYDAKGKEKTLIEEMRLNSGHRLTTGGASLVTVSLDDTKLLTMEETSVGEIRKKGKKLEFDLVEGNLFFNVNKKLDENASFDIFTSTMAIGIRGTSAFVGNDLTGHETVMVTDGIVHIVATNPITHEITEADVPAGMKITIFLDEEAEGEATISFTMEPFKEEDLPAMALDTIQKNEELRKRVVKETGFSDEKLLTLAKLNTVEGTSMYGQAADDLYLAGIEDAIPFMGQRSECMIIAANDAVDIAGDDLDLEVAIIKGLGGTVDVVADNDDLDKEQKITIIHKASEIIEDVILKVKDSDLPDDEVIHVTDIVSDTIKVVVEELIGGNLTIEEIGDVIDTIGDVIGDTIDSVTDNGTAGGADSDTDIIADTIAAIENKTEDIKDTVRKP